MKFNNVTIAIGATDECVSLEETVTSIIENCNHQDIDCILIVVSRNATQSCLKTVDSLVDKNPLFVKKLIQQRPYIGGAMQDAIDFTESSHIMFFASDLTNNLDIVATLIDAAKQSPEVITKTSRWLEKNSFYRYNFLKKIINFLGQDYLRFLFNTELTDLTNPVLIAPVSVYKNIRFKELKFQCLLEAVLIPLKMGCKIVEIPVKCYGRTEGRSKNSIFQTMMFAKTAIRIRFSKIDKLTK